MIEPVITLAGRRFQECLIAQIEGNKFGATEPLEELAIYAREVWRASPPPQYRVLAFVLETALRRWAYDASDQPVQLSEMAALRRAFQPPITQAADCLAGKGGDPIAIAGTLIETISTALPRLNP